MEAHVNLPRMLVLALLCAIPATSTRVSAGAPCTSVRLQGCARKARACVATGNVAEAERRAVEAFKATYRCGSATVTSYSGSCTESAHDKCDLRP